jgi:hypothetical protein
MYIRKKKKKKKRKNERRFDSQDGGVKTVLCQTKQVKVRLRARRALFREGERAPKTEDERQARCVFLLSGTVIRTR